MHRTLLIGLLALACAIALPDAARAQGKGHGPPSGPPPGQVKKAVTTDDAIVVSKDIFGKRGYDVVRIERKGDVRIIYYRRGNMGRGKGKGPVERMVIRPSGTRVIFEGGPRLVIADLKIRLGL